LLKAEHLSTKSWLEHSDFRADFQGAAASKSATTCNKSGHAVSLLEMPGELLAD
jgi:hypothetical protein